MAFDRPTLATLIDRIKADIKARTDGDPFLRRSIEAILSKALAGATHGLYGFLAWIAKQVIPTTSDEAQLLRWGQVFGVERNAASKAERVATMTGSNGTVIPDGTTFQLADGTEFVSTADATASGGTASVSLEAVLAGTDANADTGATISLSGPIAGIDTDGTIAASGQVDGADEEDIEDYRARLLEHIQSPPRGGAEGDYVTWAKEVAGVTRAWEFPQADGIGTIALTFVRDDDVSMIPSEGERVEVQEYLDSKAPLDIQPYSTTERVHVWVPTENPIDMTIQLSPNDAATQAAVTAELEDLFFREAAPGEATPVLSKIDEAIATAAGEDDHEITAIDSLAPSSTAINTLGVITFEAMP